MSKKMLSLRDIELLNIIDFLCPYKENIREVFKQKGTAAATTYVLKLYKIRLKGYELREILNTPPDSGVLCDQEGHKVSWEMAGWNGNYSPLGYARGDDKPTELKAAGLINKGEKLVKSF